MAKRGALGSELLVGGSRLSNDIGQVNSITTPVGVQDVTGIDKSARETLLLLRDGSITFTPFFNPATGRAHPILSALPRTDVITSFLVANAQGEPAFCLNGKQNNYDASRSPAGELTFSTTTNGNGYGGEWCEILTDDGITTSTSAENLASLDGGAATDFGLQAYLHVLSFSGTSITVTLEDSADNASFSAITGGAFTAATAAGAERIQTARDATIRRYVRCALTGTYSSAVILVAINRNTTEVLF
jgi:hypothetical protein